MMPTAATMATAARIRRHRRRAGVSHSGGHIAANDCSTSLAVFGRSGGFGESNRSISRASRPEKSPARVVERARAVFPNPAKSAAAQSPVRTAPHRGRTSRRVGRAARRAPVRAECTPVYRRQTRSVPTGRPIRKSSNFTRVTAARGIPPVSVRSRGASSHKLAGLTSR